MEPLLETVISHKVVSTEEVLNNFFSELVYISKNFALMESLDAKRYEVRFKTGLKVLVKGCSFSVTEFLDLCLSLSHIFMESIK